MTILRRLFAGSLLTTLLFMLSISLNADGLDSRITAVTVYADRAIVTRTMSQELTAGEHTVIFENLPYALVDQSLQASGFGIRGASILDVTSKSSFADEPVNERVKKIEDQIKLLQKQRRALDDRSRILDEQRGFVQRMLQSSTAVSTGSNAGGPAARPTLDEWQKLFSYSDETLGRIAGEQQSIDGKREDIQSQQTAHERELNELRGAIGRRSKTVQVRVALASPGRLDVALRYALPNAGWTPAYDARLRSADRAVDLSYFGIVKNGTGEDWNNVAMTLSTARPNLGGGAPELRPWIADVYRPRLVAPGFASAASTATVINPDLVGEIRIIGAPVDTELGRANGQVQITTRNSGSKKDALAVPPAEAEAATLAANVETSITSATFKIPVPVTIPGNSVSQRVAIKDARFAATLQYQSTPKVMEAAFLSAFANNTGDYPMLAGPMNTFFDETFIAASQLKTVMPGEKFELALGADEGISVKRRLVNRFSEETGFGSKSKKVTYEFLVTLTNNKPTAEKVVFKEPTPIARDEKINVKVLTPQEKEIGTIANPKEVTREEDGRLVWRVTLKPGEKREFPLKISIEHPGDIPVTGLE